MNHGLYKCDGGTRTLNEVISLHHEALGLWPAPHPNRPQSLQNLANTLLSQFEQNGAVESLDEAILLHRPLDDFQICPPNCHFRG